jgi:hypothetical protein
VIITGASTSCWVALRRHLIVRKSLASPDDMVFPAHRWCASVRLASCRTAGTSVWSLVQLPQVSGFRPSREVPNRLRPLPTVPGWLLAVALGASSVKRDPRGPSGRRGAWRSIATESSRVQPQSKFVTVDGSRNHDQEGDVRLLASGDAGEVAMRQHRRDEKW